MARDLAFTREEYERRLGRVREEMAARGLDVLLAVNPVSTKYLLSAGDHERLAAALAGCRLADGSGLVRAALRVKSSEELACIRSAATMTAAGMQAADAAVSGATDNQVAAAASQALIAAGSEFPCLSPVVTTGVRSGVPHTTYRAMSPRRNGRYGIAVSETFVVTPSGCEVLTDFPREFFAG